MKIDQESNDDDDVPGNKLAQASSFVGLLLVAAAASPEIGNTL